jgi:signal transduction histidine kinase/ligand-binding sensor domain-containing protein/AraC-like DNA-binding protein
MRSSRNYFLSGILLLIFIMGIPVVLQAQQEDYSIEYLTIDAGLPQNEVTSIIQDRKGFLWFGTRGGLARYDGHKMRVFQYDPGSVNSLSNNSIETLFEDRYGNIWIGTKSGGLNFFDPVTELFRTYQSDPNDPTTISGNRIVSIEEDDDGRIWVGTWKHGLNWFDRGTEKFHRLMPRISILALKKTSDGTLWICADDQFYKKVPASPEPVRVGFIDAWRSDITSFVIDEEESCLWLGGWENGLIKYDLKQQRQVQEFVHDARDPNTISSKNVYSLFRDKDKQLWAGFWGGGINIIDSMGRVKRFPITPNTAGKSHPDYDIVLSIFQDRSGILWVGTDGGGVCKIQKKKDLFKTYTSHNSNLSSGHILSILEDSRGRVWLGTKVGGLNRLEDGKITHHQEIYETVNDQDANVVHTVYEDDKGVIWFGTGRGLHKILSITNNKINSVIQPLDLYDPEAVSDRKVMAILKDRKGKFWVGTQQNGLYCSANMDGRNPVFKNYQAAAGNKYSLSENRISVLFEDSKGRLWVGTYKGLHLYQENADRFIGIHHERGNVQSLSNDIINCIGEDAAGNIWVGTSGGLNLVRYEHGELKATYYTKKDGLPNDYINALLVDARQNLWISSNAGIFQFDPATHLIQVYTVQDGLQSNAFSEGAACLGKNGLMYFGGSNGFNVFDPQTQPHPSSSPLALVSLKIMNQEVHPRDTISDRVLLQRSFVYTHEITLTHLDKVISVEVSSIDFSAPEKNQYAFKLEGFDDDWVNTGNNKLITYTNLKPGDYTLHVKASDVGNVWNEETIQLAIHVLPPPWKTWWAYLGYAALIALVAFVAWKDIEKRIQLKNQLHAMLVIRTKTEAEQQKEKEISEMKLRFFTNVSHELRTPLTLISSPLEEMLAMNTVVAPIREKLMLMHRHTNRLLVLVNQLLDLRKSETGNLQLVVEQTDVVKFVYDIFESFSHMAARRKIAYSFQSDLDHLLIELDRNKIEIAVTNILSNAFKYSADTGKITCTLSIEKDPAENKIFCLIHVRDTGQGMPKEALEKIFDLYYQVSRVESVKVSGSGIGLSLVKEIVQLHGGAVSVASEEGKGSVFTIKLPVRQSPGLNIVSVSRDVVLENVAGTEELATITGEVESSGDLEKPVLLVIEDTDELRNYLAQLLGAEFFVLEARSGEDGLKLAFDRIPDLIVSDVMMESMDGFEVCRRIKTNERTSHIPVILLTAKILPENELLGLKNGADDYIKKPFNPTILTARMHRLLDARKQLKEYYSRKVTLQPTNIEITPYDEKFLKKAMSFIEANLLTPGLNNESLEAELGMSHSTLYRKLKALTGLSIHEFIRSIRLKRAAQLLESGEVSVSEAAYQTGFSEMKYFRAYFKGQFGCLPSEYVRTRNPQS